MQGTLVHGIQVDRSLLLTLATRQEGDAFTGRTQELRNILCISANNTIAACFLINGTLLKAVLTGDSGGHGAAQGGDGGHGDLLVAVLVRTGMSSSNHVGLKQSALQVDMVVRQGLVHSSQDLLCDVLATLQVMVAVGQNLGLHDGHDAMLR